MFFILCRNIPTMLATKALVKWHEIRLFVYNYKYVTYLIGVMSQITWLALNLLVDRLECSIDRSQWLTHARKGTHNMYRRYYKAT